MKDDGVRHGTFCEVVFKDNGDGTYTKKEQEQLKPLADLLSNTLNKLAREDGYFDN